MSYVEPCEQYIAPPLQLYTGTAAATIVGVSVSYVACVCHPGGEEPTPTLPFHTHPFSPSSVLPCQVTIGLLLVSYFLWSRYGRMEDPERQQLLEEIRARLADGSIADEYGNEGTPLRG